MQDFSARIQREHCLSRKRNDKVQWIQITIEKIGELFVEGLEESELAVVQRRRCSSSSNIGLSRTHFPEPNLDSLQQNLPLLPLKR